MQLPQRTRTHCKSTSRTLWNLGPVSTSLKGGPSFCQARPWKPWYSDSRPVAPKKLLALQNPRPQPRCKNQNLYLNEIPRQFTFALTFEKHCLKARPSGPQLSHWSFLFPGYTRNIFSFQMSNTSPGQLHISSLVFSIHSFTNSLIQSTSFFFFPEHPFYSWYNADSEITQEKALKDPHSVRGTACKATL